MTSLQATEQVIEILEPYGVKVQDIWKIREIIEEVCGGTVKEKLDIISSCPTSFFGGDAKIAKWQREQRALIQGGNAWETNK